MISKETDPMFDAQWLHGAHTLFTDDVEGAGEVDLVVGGTSFTPTAVPSGPLTETLGISVFGGGLPMAGAPAEFGCCCCDCCCLRAPGGIYAFEPRTTAPYLRCILGRASKTKKKEEYLSSSLTPLSSRFRFLSSAMCGLLVVLCQICEQAFGHTAEFGEHTPMISLAMRCAFRSLSLKSTADRSSLVV